MTRDLDVFHQGIYEQSFEEIRTLKRNLPEDAVISLAREVLQRVADRGSVIKVATPTPLETQVEELAQALISHDPHAGANIIRTARADGASLEEVYLLYLAEAARLLGIWWEHDRISLVDVTVGAGRIYAIMRGLSKLFPLAIHKDQKSAMFTVVPGETHTLGLKMVTDLFRKNGWDIDLKIDMTSDALAQDIRQSHPRIVGLSAGGQHTIATLAKLIINIRINSPATAVLVSGHVVQDSPELVNLMGPDAIAFDFEDIEREMERLWVLTNPADKTRV
ncbi:MAG: cobalamin-dependent protein [Pseudomonadota bacterium]